MPTAEQVVDFIQLNPRVKAQRIADHFHVDRTAINQLLYGPILRNRVERDPAYRWRVRGNPQVPPPAVPPPAGPVGANPVAPPHQAPVLRTPAAGNPQAQPPTAAEPMPRLIKVAASSHERHASVYEGAAIPRVALSVVASDGLLPKGSRRALSQWMAEWPSNIEQVAEGDIPAWLAVTGKLLRRGTIIPLDPGIEEQLRPIVGDPPSIPGEWIKAASEILNLPFEQPVPDPDTYDSPAECRFFEDLLPKLESPSLLRFWQRQVSLGSLTGNAQDFQTAQRVDFLFAYPDQHPLVVEIDGEQHADQREHDAQRDLRLRNAGIDVVRVPIGEVYAGGGDALSNLQDRLSTIRIEVAGELSIASRWLIAGRRIQQIQLLLVEAFEKGILPRDNAQDIQIHIQTGPLLEEARLSDIGVIALQDFNRLTEDVTSVLGLSSRPTLSTSDPAEASLCISFGSEPVLGVNNVLSVRDAYFPAPSELYTPIIHPFSAQSVDMDSCQRLLQRIYGFPQFHEGQFEAIERALLGQDSLVLLPTGSGKSIAFQLAAFLRPGVAIVVDPIVSLIEDQLENLRNHGIDRAERIIGTQTQAERDSVMTMLARSQYWFCYVAPERFQIVDFRNHLGALTTNTPVALVAVDEAHCVSEWGHDFRTAYLNLAKTARKYCATGGSVPPVMGLTGTASRSVLKDIQRELNITDFNSVIVPKSFDRQELSFAVASCPTPEKPHRLGALLHGLPARLGVHQGVFFENRGAATQSGLLFCPWVNGDQGVVTVGQIASRNIGREVPVYASTVPNGENRETWPTTLRRTSAGFRRNQFPVMACTKAFGMGIDKPNVRYTIHYNLPSSVESFYQEAGRAGRDGRQAHCLILLSNDNPARTAQLLNPATPTETLRNIVAAAGFNDADDITRAFFFLNNAFQGMEREEQVLNRVISALGPLNLQRRTTIPFNAGELGNGQEEQQNQTEKALHRLVLAGAVADYTKDWGHRTFEVEISGSSQEVILEHLYRYIATYQRQRGVTARKEAQEHINRPFNDFVLAVAHQITHFVYDVVERGRRQALAEILRICEMAADGEDMRQPILDYLGRSKYAEQIEKIIQSSEDAGVGEVASIVRGVSSVMDAAELRGECARLLGAYPDQPSLRLLRAAAEAMTRHPDENIISQNVEAAVRFGTAEYGLPIERILDAVLLSAEVISDARPEVGTLLLHVAVLAASDRRLASRYLLKEVGLLLQNVGEVREHLLGPPLASLLQCLVESIQHLHEGDTINA